MKRFLVFVALIFLYPVSAHAQVYPAPPNVGLAANLPHTCVVGAPLNPTQPQWFFATDTSTLYVCISNTASYPSNWGSVSGGGGGSGCVPSGSVGQILSDSGSGTCNDSTLTDNGTDVTGSEPLFLGTDNSTAGQLRLSNGSASAHTILLSGATTTNTIKGFTVAPTTTDLISCTTSATICTLTDSGIALANAVTAASTLTSTAFMTGGGSKAAQTPSATSTLDSSGDASFAGTLAATGHTTFEGVTSTGATGTGNLVYSGSPTLVTPALGTPSALVLTNATGLPCGAMPALTGAVTSSAASCATSFQSSPSFTTPNIGAATGTSLLVSGNVDGTAPLTITTGTSASLGGTFKSGYTVNQEATAGTGVTYTLPTAAAGLQYCINNGWNGSAADTGILTLSTSASGQFIYNLATGTLTATGGNLTSAGAAGDSICVRGDDSTHWTAYAQFGTWTVH